MRVCLETLGWRRHDHFEGVLDLAYQRGSAHAHQSQDCRAPFRPGTWAPEGPLAALAPINPCGMVCDFIRSAYTTTMRFFQGSDFEIPVRWYFAKDGAQLMPFWHRFAS